MDPNKLAIFILFAWPFIMLILGMVIPVRRVVLIAIIGGNLFLPPTGIVLSGLPNYTKLLAAGIGALLPAFIFASSDLFKFRPKLLDLFFIGFLVAPGISSLLNGLGPYDALAVTVNRFLEWGVAYWIGRTLFTDLPSLRDLCVAVVVSAMAYAPLCLFEIVMSPQLCKIVYGFFPESSQWVMTKRMGGWRPQVFMQHGLALAAWMATAALVAWILWRSRAIRNIWGIPISWIAIGLVILTIMLRSTGAALLLLALIAAAEFIQSTRLRPLLLVLVLAPMGYIGLRTFGWHGEQLVQLVEPLGQERAGSLNMRLENDQMIVDKVMRSRPIFGSGGWGRWRVYDDFGNDITVSDSWWSILVGTTGLFGLFCTYATFIAPLFPLSMHKSRKRIFLGPLGAAWAIGLGILLFVLDSLANAMPNTSFMVMTAALVSIYALVSPKAIQRMMMQQQQASSEANDEDTEDPEESEPAKRLKTA